MSSTRRDRVAARSSLSTPASHSQRLTAGAFRSSARIFSTRNTTGPSCRCSACSSSRRAPKRATLAWKDGSASELSRPAVPDKLCRGRTFLRWSESAAPSGRCRTKNEPRRHAMNKQWAQYWIGLFADGTDELMTLYAPEFQFEDVNFDLRINSDLPALSAFFERSEEHTSEIQSLMRNSYAVFCLTEKTNKLQKNAN